MVGVAVVVVVEGAKVELQHEPKPSCISGASEPT